MVKHSLSGMWHIQYNTPVNLTVIHQTENHRSKALCFVFSILRYLHELQYFAIDKISIYELRKFFNIYVYCILRNQEKIIHLHLKHSELLYINLHPLLIALNLCREFDIQDIFSTRFSRKIFVLAHWSIIYCTESWKDLKEKNGINAKCSNVTNSFCSQFAFSHSSSFGKKSNLQSLLQFVINRFLDHLE